MEVAAAAIAAVMGILMLLSGVRGVQTGIIRSRYGTHRRDESPKMFWIAVLGYLGAGLILIPFLIRKILTRG